MQKYVGEDREKGNCVVIIRDVTARQMLHGKCCLDTRLSDEVVANNKPNITETK